MCSGRLARRHMLRPGSEELELLDAAVESRWQRIENGEPRVARLKLLDQSGEAGGADSNGDDLRSPVRDALVMAGAYALGAFVPLIPFILTFIDKVPAFIGAGVLALAMLYWLGVVKATVGHQPKVRSGIQLLLLATAAGIVGFLLGALAREVFGIEV